MRRRTRLGVLVGLGVLALAAVGPAAAQTSSTNTEQLIWDLNQNLLFVAIPITVLVEGILIYAVYRFKDNDDPTPTQENRRLEITWTVATAVILLFVGIASFQVLGVGAVGGVTAASNPDAGPAAVSHEFDGAVGPEPGEDAVQVEVVAQKYFWTYNYTDHGISRSSTLDQPLVLPANRTVYLHVTSLDWLHAFHVPGMGLKQDAFPGKYNTIKTTPLETGSHQLYCAEYCGVGHSGMLGTVQVVSPSEYQQWLDERTGNATEGDLATPAGA